MATKKVKKVSKVKHRVVHSASHISHHEKSLKAVLSLLIAMIALSMLLVFIANENTIMMTGSFNLFITLVAIGLALLAGLLYLLNPQRK